jgi:hypothetical protein
VVRPLRKLPVLKELGAMKMPPLQHERKRSRCIWPLTLPSDPDGDVGAGIPSVKMRWVMLPIVDGDDDSEEAAYLGHSGDCIETKRTGGLAATRFGSCEWT